MFIMKRTVAKIGEFIKINNLECRCRSTSIKLKRDTQFHEKDTIYQEQFLKVGKWNINYLKVGSGPHTVLCVPGALGTMWTHLGPQIEGLDKDKFTVVALDCPGYGKSRPPAKQYPSTYFHTDADLLYEFMETLKIPKYSVLGWSGGGIGCLILAAKYPQVMDKLVVWGSNAFILPSEIELYKKPIDINLWAKNLKNEMISVYGEELYHKYLNEWREGMLKVFEERNGNICADIIQNIRCQTLVLSGDQSPVVDSLHARHLHAYITNSRLHVYPEGKHDIHLQNAEDFNKTVQEFLLEPVTNT